MNSTMTAASNILKNPPVFGRPLLAFCLGFGIPIAALGIGLALALIAYYSNVIGADPGENTFNAALAAAYVILVPLLLLLPRLTRTNWEILGFAKLSFGTVTLATTAGIFSAVIAPIITRTVTASPSPLPSASSFLPPHAPLVTVALTFVVLTLAGPIYEEVAFRILMFNALRQWRINALMAMLIPAVVFAAMHLSFADGPAFIVIGCIFTLVYLRSKSAWAPIIAHSVYNGIPLLVVSIPHYVSVIYP